MSGDGLVYEVRRNVYSYLDVAMLTMTASESYHHTLFTCLSCLHHRTRCVADDTLLVFIIHV